MSELIIDEVKDDVAGWSTEDLVELVGFINSILDCRRDEGDPLA